MIISMIAAHDPNLVIGKSGSLPWNYPEDMEHFRNRTKGHSIVMGRGVFEEIGQNPLPRRRNIVMTCSRSFSNVDVCRSKQEVLENVAGELKVYIIGGADVYKLFYPESTRLEITLIHKNHEGDVYFPEYRKEIGSRWKEVFREERQDMTFIDFDRIIP